MPSSGSPYLSDLSFMITFRYSNYTRLVSFLGNLSDPSSPQYGHYLTRGEFIHEFSPRASFYSRAVEYFASHGFSDITAYGDRVSIYMTGSAQLVENTLNVSVVRSGGLYGPTSAPEVPEWMNTYTIGITGLTDRGSASLIGSGHAVMAGSPGAKTASGYGTPINVNGVQYIYGADMQVAYNEQKLLNMTIPKNAVEATILWSGYNKTTGTYTAPFYPQDVYEYYNASIPSGQPHAKVYGVPLNGAPAPGSSAQYDSSGAVFENTLDLEMMGSTAPGSSIYNVYANANSMSQLDANFAYILNPAHTPGLNNVSVISNSWGSNDQNDTTWMTYLQESQARGITVLASSGDSGDNTNSKKYLGGPGYAEFPSSMAYNSFGVTAVGGTTVTLKQTLKMSSQIAWYISAIDTTNGGPAGSTGGISSVFAEPDWQKTTQANTVIHGAGRATPDIAALANNTLVYITKNGKSYYANPYFYYAWGTSVASPLVGGMIAAIDQYLIAHGMPALGFLNPRLYRLANEQYNTSTLTVPPFQDIVSGRNHVYNALVGYDLVTGLGSINAYNMTTYESVKKYQVTFTESGLPSGRKWYVNLTNGVSSSSITGSVYINVTNGTYTYLVSVVGAYGPSPPTGNFTVSGANVIRQVTYSTHTYSAVFSETGLVSGNWTVSIRGSASNASAGNHVTLSLVNGTYTYAVSSSNQSLKANSGTLTVNGSSTSTLVTFYTYAYEVSFVETGLKAGLTWSVVLNGKSNSSSTSTISFFEPTGNYSYTVTAASGYQASRPSGIVSVHTSKTTINIVFSLFYSVKFTESGLPSGTYWAVELGGTYASSNSSHIFFNVSNGVYSFSVAAAVTGSYSASPSSGNVTVSSSNVTQQISFSGLGSHSALESGDLYVYVIFAVIVAAVVVGTLILSRGRR